MFPVKLSLEQKFVIARFGEDVKTLSQKESQELLVKVYRQMVVNETLYKEMILTSSGFSGK
jgi:hypothetical protein